GNSASGAGFNDGGGIRSDGTLTLTNSTLSGNSVSGSSSNNFGGGIYNAGTSTITNSTLSGNSISGGGSVNFGGGIYRSSGTLTLTNSTLSGNSVSGGIGNDGGGIYNNSGATPKALNTIIAKNTAGNGPDVNGTFTSLGHNLIGISNGSTGFTNGQNGDRVGTTAAPIDPLLAALGNYGGPTQTIALLPGSPAIDAGDNCVTQASHCGDASISQIGTDQRTLANRMVNGNVDIGAFESRGFTIAVTSGTPQSAVFGTAVGSPLVATVSSAFAEPIVGGQVIYTAPPSGASATFTGGVTTLAVIINASNQASANATANGTVGGPYNVSAGGSGIAGTATFSLTNTQSNQTITFNALGNKTFGGADFAVSATASSNLPVSFTASGNCTISTNTVHLAAAGSCTITAKQAIVTSTPRRMFRKASRLLKRHRPPRLLLRSIRRAWHKA
ncbi:MAG TPA: choice-of-anchor Q domain-containing protein, partial [Pyrinomonadaceae bacterium]